jgi:phosphate uptake regulator
MTELPDIPHIHDQFTVLWHQDPAMSETDLRLVRLIIEQHNKNFVLWHEEDRARAPQASPQEIAQTKRNIDALNQGRNDLIEIIDTELLLELKNAGVTMSGPLHSETPAMMIDRLSILSLKIFHTIEQTHRAGVAAEHIHRNRERLEILKEQRVDLASALNELWRDVLAGKRRFKLYRQLKMYNDPELNPELYRGRR